MLTQLLQLAMAQAKVLKFVSLGLGLEFNLEPVFFNKVCSVASGRQINFHPQFHK